MTDHVDETVGVGVPEAVVLPPPADPAAEARAAVAAQLVEEAQAKGVNLVGPDGLLADITKRVLELGLEVEMNEHLGYEKHAVEGHHSGNSRNGTRTKTVLTDVGPARSMCRGIATGPSSRRRYASANDASRASTRW